ncbi:MAG: hypothetical protein UV66_C0003G0011 [Candidatus Woesebacteria bacterium GW2011_GWA1_43_12]|uniref:Membrane protein 6-pyruvoyl-tetrahydropterin synthase-related domain-containing protein n=1 Tax=Candidatus Woesebacteria bacterium GW2011_GWA1_43_12 TaxID=1618557 RepID=A0A0G1FUL8_9BACT|nr:MAG: hypothetical protein UV66_C0003G0011 [Candidatus Woesebacteria bacterium GW2011_GWA1_43_12]
MRRHVFPLLVIFIFAFWAVRSLMVDGYFPMHDDTQVGRIVVMGRALRNGQFPVRWVSDLGYGYGYPIFNFYGPLPYYLGGAFYMLGMSSVVAAKTVFLLGILFAGITMYVLVGSMMGAAAGVLAGVLVIYAPYHAVQVFVRGAMGELWALVFIPLVILGIMQKRWAVWGGIGLAGVILSHTILGYVTVLWYIAALLLYSIYLLVKKQLHLSFIIYHLSFLAIGLSLSAFFWLPAMAEMGWTSVAGQISATADYRNHFVCLSQFWNSLWGFGGSAAGCIDGMSFKLGKLHIVLAFAGVLLWGWRRHAPIGLIVLGVGGVLAAIFFMLRESLFLWNMLPFFSYIQYPWRFLTYAIVGLSMLGAVSIRVIKHVRVRWIVVLLLSAFAVVVNAKWFSPQFAYQRPAETFETDEELRFRVSKISDEYLPHDIVRPTSALQTISQPIIQGTDYTVETEVDTETYSRFVLTSNAGAFVRIDKAYFPGWVYLVNGKNTQPKIINGLPEIQVPSGTSVVEIHFYNTSVRNVGNLISALAMLTLFFIYGKNKTKIIT